MVAASDERKIAFRVTPETHARMAKLIPYGVRGPLLVKLLETILDSIDEHGPIVVGVLLGNSFDIKMREKKDGHEQA